MTLPAQSERRFVVQECPDHGIISEDATINGYCPVAVGEGENCAILLGEPFTVEEVEGS